MRYVQSRRLELVRADLADPDLASEPIARIAERRGFFCAASFSRAFRRTYGMTPRDMRTTSRPRTTLGTRLPAARLERPRDFLDLLSPGRE